MSLECVFYLLDNDDVDDYNDEDDITIYLKRTRLFYQELCAISSSPTSI